MGAERPTRFTPAPFLAGCAWPPAPGVPYPRHDPLDASRLPCDTWAAAQLPAGVRLELVGDAEVLELEYRTATDELGYRGEGAGRRFEVYAGDRRLDSQRALLGSGRVRLRLGPVDEPSDRRVVYLPEGMRPEVLRLSPGGGEVQPAPPQPRWIAYGDSILEGWVASAPASAWGAVAARRVGLDLVNLGYAGSARGELVSAEAIAALPGPAVISLSHGTNCWSMVPHRPDLLAVATDTFLEVLRQGHPSVPLVALSPIVRPDAEHSSNRRGATLADLRRAMEDVYADWATRDPVFSWCSGAELLTADLLADGIHPGDQGHAALAARLGPLLAAAAGVRPGGEVPPPALISPASAARASRQRPPGPRSGRGVPTDRPAPERQPGRRR